MRARGCELPRNHDIAIRGNRIARVEPTGVLEAGSTREVIEGGGRLAMSGLINTHAHVPMALFRGLAEDVDIATWFNDCIWPLESNLAAEDVGLGMQLGPAEMIQAGVTVEADHYFHMDGAVAAVERAGTRAALGWGVFGSRGDAGAERTARFAEKYRGTASGRIRTWLASHAPYTCDDAFLAACARQAEQLGAGIHIQAAETAGQTQASLAASGRTPIQVLADAGVLDGPAILAHCVGVTSGDIELMAQRPCGVAHAPKTSLKLAMGAHRCSPCARPGCRSASPPTGRCRRTPRTSWSHCA